MLTDSVLLSSLRRHWNLEGAQVTVHNGGMGSQTWFVDLGGVRWVAKAVAARDGVQFAGGMTIARRLEQVGIPAGGPVRAGDGRLVVPAGDDWLALLTWVPGHELTGEEPVEQKLIGTTLARVHRALADFTVENASRFHWVDPEAEYLSLRPWLRPAVTAALRDLDDARPEGMSWGLLHSDPAPGAFRLDLVTGRCGVIDWSYAIYGPLLYDLASAVMYVGGRDRAQDLIQAYLDDGALGAAEVEHGLAPMLRFRWAVQANYFAWRISENNLTGITGPEENEKGLDDARRSLAT